LAHYQTHAPAGSSPLAWLVAAADLIGWRSITITPDMVGTTVAIFASIEVKTPTGRVSPQQQAWMAVVQGAGGIAGVARSVCDANEILR
jgi:hypothetical protein